MFLFTRISVMNDTIICPHCKQTIPLTDALSHQVQEKYARFYKIRLDEEKKKIEDVFRKETEERVKKQIEMEMKDKSNEINELKRQKEIQQEQLLETNKLIRQLKTENDKKQLELEKKLIEEQEKIRFEEKKKADEENRMRILEKDKQLNDAIRVNEELRRKLEQGSQQSQGEVMEEELKKILITEFPYDEINDVPKGINGADLIQIVKNNYGKSCGIILWESKRTKAWTDSWLTKLRTDQREIKAEVAIIVSQVLPDDIKNFGVKDNIWVTNYQSIIGAAIALRSNLISVYSVRSANKGKEEKKEILWNYLTSIEFKQRVDAIYESYNGLLDELKREKDWFTKKWAREEKSIGLIKDNLLGMHGDLEGIVGKTLPEIEEIKKIEDSY